MISVGYVVATAGMYEIRIAAEDGLWRFECPLGDGVAMPCIQLEESLGTSALDLAEVGRVPSRDAWTFLIRRSAQHDSLYCYTGPNDARVSVLSNGTLVLDEKIAPVYEASCAASCNTSDLVEFDVGAG